VFFAFSMASVISASAFIVWNRSASIAQASVRAFYWLSIFLSLVALLYILWDSLGVPPKYARSAWVLRVLIYRAWLVIGIGVSCAVWVVLDIWVNPLSKVITKASRTFVSSPYLSKGICLSVSLSFLCTEIGKLTHDSDMRQFFLQSGYPVWFLYFTMAAETAGAIVLLVRRATNLAAFGLALIMLGAIGTHLHNHDPISDSLEALHLLVLLACILVINLLGEKRRGTLSSVTGNSC
jgi:uncharacterized membrane protein YphA (DoxX/SURF4 family)